MCVFWGLNHLSFGLLVLLVFSPFSPFHTLLTFLVFVFLFQTVSEAVFHLGVVLFSGIEVDVVLESPSFLHLPTVRLWLAGLSSARLSSVRLSSARLSRLLSLVQSRCILRHLVDSYPPLSADPAREILAVAQMGLSFGLVCVIVEVHGLVVELHNSRVTDCTVGCLALVCDLDSVTESDRFSCLPFSF